MKKFFVPFLCLLCLSFLACSEGVKSKKFKRSKPSSQQDKENSEEEQSSSQPSSQDEKANSVTGTEEEAGPAVSSIPVPPPTVSIDEKSLPHVNGLNAMQFPLGGACSTEGYPVKIRIHTVLRPSGELSEAQTTCQQGAWKATMDLAHLAAGTLLIDVHHTSSNQPNPPVAQVAKAQASVTKEPTVTILSVTEKTLPSGTKYILQGACSERDQEVTVRVGSRSPSSQPTCQSSGQWTTEVGITDLPAGSVLITANHETTGGQKAQPFSETHTKGPSLSLSVDSSRSEQQEDGTSLLMLTGLCSEEGGPITLTVEGQNPSPTPACTQGAWEKQVDITHIPSGSFSIMAQHEGRVQQVQGAQNNNNPQTPQQTQAAASQIQQNIPQQATSSPQVNSMAAVSIIHTKLATVSMTKSLPSVDSQQMTFSGVCSENNLPVTVKLFKNGLFVKTSSPPLCAKNQWTLTLDVMRLDAGSIAFTVSHLNSTDLTQAQVIAQVQGTVIKPAPTLKLTLKRLIERSHKTFLLLEGQCSEKDREVTVQAGTRTPLQQPTCKSTINGLGGTWITSVDLTSLSEVHFVLTVEHTSPSNQRVSLRLDEYKPKPTVSIGTETPTPVSESAGHFRIYGACSESGREVTVQVGGVSPSSQPICTPQGEWEAVVDMSGHPLSGAIPITANHSKIYFSPNPNPTSLQPQAEIQIQVQARRAQVFWIHETCPTGFVPVPPSYTPTAGSNSLDYFCVAKYEMKQDSDSGQALSQAMGTPWVGIDRDTAIEQCQALGESNYDLITNEEWLTLAHNIEKTGSNWYKGDEGTGFLNQGHAHDQNYYSGVNKALAANADDQVACEGIPLASDYPCDGNTWNFFRRTHSLRSGEVLWDISGNVSEWVKDDIDTSYQYEKNMYLAGVTDSVFKARFGGPQGDYRKSIYHLLHSSHHMGIGIALVNPNKGAMLRSGFWLSHSSAGIFGFSIRNAKDLVGDQVGFRCVYHP